jgi:hypothetical protein
MHKINRIIQIHNERERLKKRSENLWTVALFTVLTIGLFVFMHYPV